jgi:hypothetical protein
MMSVKGWEVGVGLSATATVGVPAVGVGLPPPEQAARNAAMPAARNNPVHFIFIYSSYRPFMIRDGFPQAELYYRTLETSKGRNRLSDGIKKRDPKCLKDTQGPIIILVAFF